MVSEEAAVVHVDVPFDTWILVWGQSLPNCHYTLAVCSVVSAPTPNPEDPEPRHIYYG